jgi:hypothetical protein
MNTLITSANELNTQLRFEATGQRPRLYNVNGDYSTLPGQPRIELDTLDSNGYLENEHLLRNLDQLAPKLWLAGSNRICFVDLHKLIKQFVIS